MSEINPVFICGALRSGSTLFHLMLNSHPSIVNPGEFDFLFECISDNGEYPDMQEYLDFLSLDRIFNSKNLVVDDSLSYPELIQSFVSQSQTDGKVLSLNIHRHFDRIRYLYPEAKYIHLLRDPRDVARSSIGMNWAGNVYYGVDHWIDTERSWEKLELKLKNTQHIEVKFEELVSDSEYTLKSVCEFIGVSYSNKMFDYQHSSTYSKPDSTLINQWKRKLSSCELQNVESKVSEMMLAKGYKLSDNDLRHPGLFERLKLSFQNKYFIISKGIQRYGFVLYFAYRVSTKLGIKSLRNTLYRKISKINKKHLK